MRGMVKPVFSRIRIPRRLEQRTLRPHLMRPACLALSVLIGVVFGSFCQHIAPQNSYITYFAQQYLIPHSTGNFLQVASGAFLSAMALQLLVLFFSLSAIGAPLLACAPLLRGVSIGCISGYLYTYMGMRGLLANLILLWIPTVIQILCLIAFTETALITSVHLFRLNFMGQAAGSDWKIRRCLRCFVLSSTGILAASVLEGALAMIFAPVLLK